MDAVGRTVDAVDRTVDAVDRTVDAVVRAAGRIVGVEEGEGEDAEGGDEGDGEEITEIPKCYADAGRIREFRVDDYDKSKINK